MPANSTHPDFDLNLPAWLRARDVLAGEDAVKLAGDRYLPKLDSQSLDEFNAYKSRAAFFNATARTADGFLGLIFRREPTVKLPDDRQTNGDESGRSHLTPALSPARRGSASGLARALAGFIDDADMQGAALTAYARNVVNEVVGVGRAGTLVDWSGSGASRTGNLGEERAYAVMYRAEEILNWATQRVNGRTVLRTALRLMCSRAIVAGIPAHGQLMDSIEAGIIAINDGLPTTSQAASSNQVRRQFA